MTRARDELILSHAAESPAGRARRVSPFVLEALDLPTAGFARVAPAAVHAAGPLERIAAARAGAGDAPEAARRPIDGPLTPQPLGDRRLPDLSAQVQVRQVVRVPTPPHHAMVYGSALHTGRPGVPSLATRAATR